MQKDSEVKYRNIDIENYNLAGDKWWQPDFSQNLIRTLVNPFRVEYAKKVFGKNKIYSEEIDVLEVGCGGGILSEEIAKMGFRTTGVDPSELSLNSAISHALENNLKIRYEKGTNENLPFHNNSFDVIFCCDVLEHVQDLPKVISEISRVLKKGGLFIYDTFNRNCFSKISDFKVLQEWKLWAITPPNFHERGMFINPDEIRSLLQENHLDWKEHNGINPSDSYLKMLHYLHKRAAGELSYEEFTKKLLMVESCNTQIVYMGYAVGQN